jgi:hypothetical protein
LSDESGQRFHVQVTEFLKREVRVEKLADESVVSIFLGRFKRGLGDDARLIILRRIIQKSSILILRILLHLFPRLRIPSRLLLFIHRRLLLLLLHFPLLFSHRLCLSLFLSHLLLKLNPLLFFLGLFFLL